MILTRKCSREKNNFHSTIIKDYIKISAVQKKRIHQKKRNPKTNFQSSKGEWMSKCTQIVFNLSTNKTRIDVRIYPEDNIHHARVNCRSYSIQ